MKRTRQLTLLAGRDGWPGELFMTRHRFVGFVGAASGLLAANGYSQSNNCCCSNGMVVASPAPGQTYQRYSYEPTAARRPNQPSVVCRAGRSGLYRRGATKLSTLLLSTNSTNDDKAFDSSRLPSESLGVLQSRPKTLSPLGLGNGSIHEILTPSPNCISGPR